MNDYLTGSMKKTFWFVAWVILLIGLLGCGPSPEEQKKAAEEQRKVAEEKVVAEKRAEYERLISITQEVVRRQLKDPGSAQFRNISSYNSGKNICGEVNAKNSFGGYTGFKPFIHPVGQNFAVIEADIPAKIFFDNICAKVDS